MKKVIITTLLLVLAIGLIALGAEEIKVPFSAVKSSCYGQIDMTKAEFLLSEVGKDCVMEVWIEDNLSGDKGQQEESPDVVDKADLPIKEEIWNKLPEGCKVRLRVYVCDEKMLDMAGWFFTKEVMNQIMGSEWVRDNYQSFRQKLGWPHRVPIYLAIADTRKEGLNPMWSDMFAFAQFGNTFGRRERVKGTDETFSAIKSIDRVWQIFIAIPERIDVSRVFRLCYSGFDFRCGSGTTVVRKKYMDDNSAKIGPCEYVVD